MIDIFTKDCDAVLLNKWVNEDNDSRKHYFSYHLIAKIVSHYQTKFDELKKEIELLKAAKSVKKEEDEPKFKVSWVYQSVNGTNVLIISNDQKISEGGKTFSLVGVLLPDGLTWKSYTSEGKYNAYDDPHISDLILSSGKKWDAQK